MQKRSVRQERRAAEDGGTCLARPSHLHTFSVCLGCAGPRFGAQGLHGGTRALDHLGSVAATSGVLVPSVCMLSCSVLSDSLRSHGL